MDARAGPFRTLRAPKGVPNPAKQVYLHATGPENPDKLAVAGMAHVNVKTEEKALLLLGRLWRGILGPRTRGT
eukprot:1767232-Pyramimonas_sp.AAC.1